MTKGLSYQKGILFFGRRFAGGAHVEEGQIQTWTAPLTIKTLWKAVRYVFGSLPWWYKGTAFFLCIAILLTQSWLWPTWNVPDLPWYILVLFFFGSHFMFPKEWKKFHGAEHKLFSCKGNVDRADLTALKRASITNRYCSTNIAFLYFCFLLMGTLMFQFFTGWENAIAASAYGSVPASFFSHRILQKRRGATLREPLLKISFFLQRKVTCADPERIHLLAAIDGYKAFAKQEFPQLPIVECNKPRTEKEEL
ncbi:DUF1385 domain-containing protein [Thalassobacillus sp. C254]|uniref:DUF1385 domain-containing protein n=1 Tax=Thalassobacillus sp. C254 TaxID=1225341 RepID=UPI0006D12460|nr:DUF1385 domain-containing protein [Thalassobacillus sp. C254]